MSKKAKASKKIDDSVNKTAIYYDMYSSGSTISDIARHFDRSINTVKKYLREHPEYVDPGSGNRLKKSDRKVGKKKYYHVGAKQLNFRCPQELLQRIDLVPGKNRKSKYLQAFKLYTRKLPKNRFHPQLKSTSKDPLISFYCPQEIVDILDDNTDIENKDILSRNQKFIASLELLLKKHDV